MNNTIRSGKGLIWMFCIGLVSCLHGQINYIRDNYLQTFNGLNKTGEIAMEGTAVIGRVVEIPVLPGWFIAKCGGTGESDITLNADDGTQNGGRAYSYGSAQTVERALGMKGSGTQFVAIGAAFMNTTNATIPSVTISCMHEIWSVQGTTGETPFEDRLTFAYGLSDAGISVADFLVSELMTEVPILDAVSSASRGLALVADGSIPNRARDGNSDEWRQAISGSLENINWQPGQVLFVRWQDTNTSGYDAGHGIDDFQLEADIQTGQRSKLPDVGVKVDGDFSDWTRQSDLWHDPAGDVRIENDMDFLTLGASVSTDGLSLYIRTREPRVLSDSNLSIYLDTDGDPDTGTAFGGLGADMLLDFSIEQDDQRFFPVEAVMLPEGVSLPAGECIVEYLPNGKNSYTTHPASDAFEILICMASLRGIVPGGKLGILLRNRVGDFAPDLGQTFHIDVPYHVNPEGPLDNLEKEFPEDIRVASYNVLRSGPMNAGQEAGFGRQLAATHPDIIHFQELYDASASWALKFVQRWLPLESGSWDAVKQSDCITVSRYEILNSWPVDGNLVVHIDTKPAWGFESIFINAHTPAHVENQDPRISETTNLMLMIRRLMNGTEPSAPTDEFALFFIGDLNANSPKIELSSPRTGIFASEAYQSSNYWPDAYNLPLVDAAPRHTHTELPRLYTWRSLTSGNTQRLDYIFYQQSRLTKGKSFVLNTQTMPTDFLEQYSMELLDSRESDHLLLIADFRKRNVNYAWEAEDPPVPGWMYSRWLGWMYQYMEGAHFNPLHGTLYSRITENGVWIWDEELGWWFSQARLYPYAYRQSTASWIYFYPSPSPPRYYFDFRTNTWGP